MFEATQQGKDYIANLVSSNKLRINSTTGVVDVAYSQQIISSFEKIASVPEGKTFIENMITTKIITVMIDTNYSGIGNNGGNKGMFFIN